MHAHPHFVSTKNIQGFILDDPMQICFEVRLSDKLLSIDHFKKSEVDDIFSATPDRALT